jgi:hypothetical protein
MNDQSRRLVEYEKRVVFEYDTDRGIMGLKHTWLSRLLWNAHVDPITQVERARGPS